MLPLLRARGNRKPNLQHPLVAVEFVDLASTALHKRGDEVRCMPEPFIRRTHRGGTRYGVQHAAAFVQRNEYMHLGTLAVASGRVQFDLSIEAIASCWITALAPGFILNSDRCAGDPVRQLVRNLRNETCSARNHRMRD